MVSQLILKAGLFALSAALVVSTSSASNSAELMLEESRHRRLAGMFENINIRESLDRLVETPIGEWEVGQWILAAFILLLVLWCCGCLAGNRRRRRSYYRGDPSNYGRGYGDGRYNGGGRSSAYSLTDQGVGTTSGGRGACSCIENVLLCSFCYELCCRDCQDVPCFKGDGGGDDVYRREGGDMV